MKISGCKNCGTRFNGLRCPRCGRPLPITVALAILLPTIVVLVVLAAIIPDETVPRVRDLGDGATEYCFESLQSAVLFPAGVVAALVFAAVSCFIFKTKKIPKAEGPLPTGWWRYCRWTGKGLSCTIGAFLLTVLAAVGLVVLVVIPWRRFRRVVVDQETIEMHSLMRSWSLPRSRIARAKFIREDIVVKRQPRADMSFLIEDNAGKRHESVQVGRNPVDPQFASYVDVFERLESQLKKRNK